MLEGEGVKKKLQKFQNHSNLGDTETVYRNSGEGLSRTITTAAKELVMSIKNSLICALIAFAVLLAAPSIMPVLIPVFQQLATTAAGYAALAVSP